MRSTATTTDVNDDVDADDALRSRSRAHARVDRNDVACATLRPCANETLSSCTSSKSLSQSQSRRSLDQGEWRSDDAMRDAHFSTYMPLCCVRFSLLCLLRADVSINRSDADRAIVLRISSPGPGHNYTMNSVVYCLVESSLAPYSVQICALCTPLHASTLT